MNDNKKSIELTAKVVKESKKWVIFYDYGENDVYNIYNNSEIINSLISKLEGKELFEVSLIFSKPEEDVAKLPLVKELLKWRDKNKKSQNKVFIIMGQEELSNEHEYHYKINDTGSAFITKHSPGENNREFKFFTPDAIRPVKKIDECLYFHNESDSKKAA
ncbi:MAG: hypothetical protein HAW61_04670 [Candidatus Portiera sp.]|nr:hypothetical protein [Portiera sp.]